MEHEEHNEGGEYGLYQGPRAHVPEIENDHSDDPGYHSRTKFLTMVAVAMGGVMTAAILVPVIGFAIADTVKEEEWRWVDVGPLSDFPEGKTQSIAVSGPAPEADRRVFVRNRDAKLVAIWNRCAHLGCPVEYQPGGDIYVCPCHGGAYDSLGRVTAGPPPRPLDRLDVKIVTAAGADVDYANAKATDRVLIGKAYSIDDEETPYPLYPPGDPVEGVLSKLFPFV